MGVGSVCAGAVNQRVTIMLHALYLLLLMLVFHVSAGVSPFVMVDGIYNIIRLGAGGWRLAGSVHFSFTFHIIFSHRWQTNRQPSQPCD
jgi:hypothetical protein